MSNYQKNGRIAVFARTPERGKVKTRLQPFLGEEGCYGLHQTLTANAIAVAVESDIADIDIWHTGNADHSFWHEQRVRQSSNSSLQISLLEQQGRDLGYRMQFAFEQALSGVEKSDWLILIGSDCPAIDANYLIQAADLLNAGREAVVGPALDGGYVMIGLRKQAPFLFQGIAWGGPDVLSQTIAAANRHNLDLQTLEPLRDLDTEADFQYYRDRFQLFNIH